MSPALSFSGQPSRGAFWKMIQSGEKTMTTRLVRKDGKPHCAVGDLLTLYWKQRTPVKDKPIHLIGYAYTKRVTRFECMDQLLSVQCNRGSLHGYIRGEGFSDLSELVSWWTDGEATMWTTDTLDPLKFTGSVELIEWQTPIMGEKP